MPQGVPMSFFIDRQGKALAFLRAVITSGTVKKAF